MQHGSRRVGVIVNPAIRNRRHSSVTTELLAALGSAGHRFVDLSADSAEEASARLASSLAELDALVVAGGDGMVHLGLQAVAGTSVPLGVVALGTGNDFAAAAGLPVNARAQSIDLIVRSLAAAGGRGMLPLDALRVSGAGLDADRGGVVWVAGAVSAGLDAAVNARANRMRFPRGESRYVLAALAEILAYRAWDYRVTATGVALEEERRHALSTFEGLTVLDGEGAGGRVVTWESVGALLTAANSPRIGGGVRVAPHAVMDDGMLDLIIARDVGRMSAVRLFARLQRGAHLRSDDLREVRARTVTIESTGGRPPAAYGDGERLGGLPLRIEVVPGALRLLAG